MPATTILSTKDAAVLSALFDPEASLTNTLEIQAPETSIEISSSERQAIHLLNTSSPSPAEIQTAISILDSLITSTASPSPSTYVNRAQALRLLLPPSPSSFTPTSTPLLTQILSDLSTAISFSHPSSPTLPLPSTTAQTLSSAHTHRAYLLYLFSRPTTSPEIYASIPSLRGCSKEQLEDMAARDFDAGGRYGNPVAREMSVRTNPYAKLCGNIVREAMRREVEEFGGRGRRERVNTEGSCV